MTKNRARCRRFLFNHFRRDSFGRRKRQPAALSNAFLSVAKPINPFPLCSKPPPPAAASLHPKPQQGRWTLRSPFGRKPQIPLCSHTNTKPYRALTQPVCSRKELQFSYLIICNPSPSFVSLPTDALKGNLKRRKTANHPTLFSRCCCSAHSCCPDMARCSRCSLERLNAPTTGT